MEKINKNELTQLVEDYFTLTNRRMTNLRKATLKRLNEIIEEHKIPIEMLKKKREQGIAFEKEKKEKQKELLKKRTSFWFNHPTKMLWIEKWIDQHLEVDVEQNKEENKLNTMQQVAFLDDVKRRGARVTTDEKGDVMVNGIHYSFGFHRRETPLTETEKTTYRHLYSDYDCEFENVVKAMYAPKNCKSRIKGGVLLPSGNGEFYLYKASSYLTRIKQ